MGYYAVCWLHHLTDEPVEMMSELDQDAREVRKVERFRDGSWGWADAASTAGSTRLGIEPVPPLDEINRDPQFQGCEITRKQFEAAWGLARAVAYDNTVAART